MSEEAGNVEKEYVSLVNEKSLLAYDLGMDEAAYSGVERDVGEVFQELQGDSSVEAFRGEYDRLFYAVKKARENERLLVSKVRELAQQFVFQRQKYATAQRALREDGESLGQLQQDLELAQQLIQQGAASQDRQARERQALEAEVASQRQFLQDARERKALLGIPEEKTLADLQASLRQLEQNTEETEDRLGALAAARQKLLEKTARALADKAEKEARTRALGEEILQLKEKTAMQKQLKAAAETRMLQLREEIDVLAKTALEKQEALARLTQSLAGHEDELAKQKKTLGVVLREKADLEEKYSLQQFQIGRCGQDIQQQEVENSERKERAANLLEEASGLKKEAAESVAQLEKVQQEAALVLQKRQATEARLEKARDEITVLEQEIIQSKAQANELQKQVDLIYRDQQSQAKLRRVAEMSLQDKEQLLQILRQQEKVYVAELQSFQEETEKQRKLISQTEKEKDLSLQQIAQSQAALGNFQLELRRREAEISALQSQVQEADLSLRQKQQLYEQIRADRNLCSKSLVESQDQIANLRRQFRVMSHVIEQLRAEIQQKDRLLIDQHEIFRQALREKDAVQAKLEKTRLQVKDAENRSQQQKQRLSQQTFVVQEAEQEQQRQQKEFKLVEAEKNTISALLVKRNADLGRLHEQLRVQQSLLQKGEQQYRKKLQELQVQRDQLEQLRAEIQALRGQAVDLTPLKQEICKLQQDLIEEKAKSRALAQELQQPMNVHRWRQLEGSDPRSYALIQRIIELQQSLQKKTKEADDAQKALLEKEKIAAELKKLLVAMPGEEAIVKLGQVRTSLKQKKKELSDAVLELELYQRNAARLKDAVEAQTIELQRIKQAYFKRKNAELTQTTQDWSSRPEQQPDEPL